MKHQQEKKKGNSGFISPKSLRPLKVEFQEDPEIQPNTIFTVNKNEGFKVRHI